MNPTHAAPPVSNGVKFLYLAAIRLPTEKAHGLQIMKTCEALARAGAQVTLMVPYRNNPLERDLATKDPFAYYSVAPSFTITRLPGPDLHWLGAFGFAAWQLIFSEAARATRAFLEADVVYSRDAFVLLQYILLRHNLVYEAHTAPTMLSKFVARRAARVVVISNGLRLAYQKAGVPAERIINAPDAIDLAAFAPERAGAESKEAARTRLGLPQNKKIALYIGRLDGWKGVTTLCEAAAHVPPEVLVAVIGGEPDQVASFQKKYPAVQFLGYHSYQELANNQAAADVLVLPNTAKDQTSAHYTSPLKLFTYMASCRPILASDLPSIREVLTDESAYFFPPDNSDLLARILQDMLAHPEASLSRAFKARKDVEQYTWDARAAHILKGISTIHPR